MRGIILTTLLFFVSIPIFSQEDQPTTTPIEAQTNMTIEKNITNQEPDVEDKPNAEVEYKLERLRKGFTSLYHTTLPLATGILVFMLLVNRRAGRDKFAPFFGEGQFLQLVVIVMIAGNVCSLAIMGVLGTSEVSAIYGGIVGYVLGRRTSKKNDASEFEDTSAPRENK